MSRKSIYFEENQALLKEGKLRCIRCNRVKKLVLFTKDKHSPTGRRASCKSCLKKTWDNTGSVYRYNLKRRYGITEEDYKAMYETQGGKCAVCQYATGASRRLAVDHNHDTGEVRGLLCSICNKYILNKRLGKEGLLRALDYLDNPPARKVLNG